MGASVSVQVFCLRTAPHEAVRVDRPFIAGLKRNHSYSCALTIQYGVPQRAQFPLH